MHEDGNGSLWLSTYHSGLYQYTPSGKINRYELVDDEFNYIPFAIISDSLYLWIGSNKGIIRFNLFDKNFIVFDEHDGFEGVEANANAIASSKNCIYIGTVMGLCSFDKTFLSKLNYSPIPQIKKATTFPNNVPIFNGSRIVFGSNSIKFDLNGLSTTWPHKVVYWYRLLGQDSNWVRTKSPEVWYKYLKPGTYIFELRTGIDGQNLSNSKTDRITFYIKPPFWRTSWFLGICMLTVLGLLIFISKTKSRKLLLENVELEARILELQKQLDEKNNLLRKHNLNDKE
jgi:hypothetical protein